MKHKTAFTLIELLVVISIIALLIGILLPALGAARSTARTSASASNQRQIGIAMAAYQADNDGQFPLWQQDDLGQMVIGNVIWYWATKLAVDGYMPSMDLYNDPAFDADNTFLDETIDRTTMNGRIFNTIHYGYNYVWVGSALGENITNRNDAYKRRTGAPDAKPASIEDMPDPTSVAVTVSTYNPSPSAAATPAPAVNGNGNFTPGVSYGAHVVIDSDSAVTNAGIPHFRHSNGVQTLWADGHVSLIRGEITQEEQEASAIGLRGQVFQDQNGLGSTKTGGLRSGGPTSNIWDLQPEKPNN